MWEAFTTVALYCRLAAPGSSDRKSPASSLLCVGRREDQQSTFPLFHTKMKGCVERHKLHCSKIIGDNKHNN